MNFLILFNILQNANANIRADRIDRSEMTLNEGTVIGRRFENLGFESYKAIPYAKPPVGDLRWRPPVRVQN